MTTSWLRGLQEELGERREPQAYKPSAATSWRHALQEEMGERRDPQAYKRSGALTPEQIRALRKANEVQWHEDPADQTSLPFESDFGDDPTRSGETPSAATGTASPPEAKPVEQAHPQATGLSPTDAAALPPAEQPTDEDLAALNAKATAEAAKIDARDARRPSVGLFSSIASKLPPIAQAAGKLRVKHPRILKADIRPIARQTDESAIRSKLRAFYAVPRKGYPLLGSMQQALSAILHVERADGMGFANRTLKAMATIAGHSVRTFQRCKDTLVATGLIDQACSVVAAPGGGYWLDANVYVPTVDVAPAPLPADVRKPDPVLPIAVKLGGLARLAALFGLMARPTGLNTTPLRSNPSPA